MRQLLGSTPPKERHRRIKYFCVGLSKERERPFIAAGTVGKPQK